MEKTKQREEVEQDGWLEVLEGQDGVMGILGAGFFSRRQQMDEGGQLPFLSLSILPVNP